LAQAFLFDTAFLCARGQRSARRSMASRASCRLLQLATGHRGAALCAGGLRRLPPSAWASQRAKASAASAKIAKVLQSEIKHEEEQYEQPKDVKKFLESTSFKFVETEGDVNMVLERDVGDKVVRIEWQLTSPFDPAMGGEDGEDGEPEQEATDLCVTVESKSTGAGIAFYCSTQTGEDHRYVIGNLKSYASSEEKENPSSYNGPDFEDLDDKLQEAFDEYLAELGMSSEICDFIDAMAIDKEQREYVRWLKTTKACLES